MVRDEEVKRLIHYAKGLGVKIIIYNKHNAETAGEWTLDGSMIQVYASNRMTKTDLVLTLIHEIGHHVWFIHEKDRQPDLKFEEAITKENIEPRNEKIPIAKNLRKKIYDVERVSADWWDSIIKDVDIKIPSWKVEMQKEFDVWMYEEYYDTGFFPKGRVKKDKRKELQSKWQPKEVN